MTWAQAPLPSCIIHSPPLHFSKCKEKMSLDRRATDVAVSQLLKLVSEFCAPAWPLILHHHAHGKQSSAPRPTNQRREIITDEPPLNVLAACRALQTLFLSQL